MRSQPRLQKWHQRFNSLPVKSMFNEVDWIDLISALDCQTGISRLKLIVQFLKRVIDKPMRIGFGTGIERHCPPSPWRNPTA